MKMYTSVQNRHECCVDTADGVERERGSNQSYLKSNASCLVHGRLVVAPVLHELRRQLHGVPLNPVDAGAVPVLHGRQHVLQTVPELVEQGFHLD